MAGTDDKDTFMRLYKLSGGFASDGERLWAKKCLEKSAPDMFSALKALVDVLETKPVSYAVDGAMNDEQRDIFWRAKALVYPETAAYALAARAQPPHTQAAK